MINVFIRGPLENQHVEGQPSLKELNIKQKYENINKIYDWSAFALDPMLIFQLIKI